MNPKEKAVELVEKMLNAPGFDYKTHWAKKSAIDSALTAVEEIIKNNIAIIKFSDLETANQINALNEFSEKVRTEITNL